MRSSQAGVADRSLDDRIRDDRDRERHDRAEHEQRRSLDAGPAVTEEDEDGPVVEVQAVADPAHHTTGGSDRRVRTGDGPWRPTISAADASANTGRRPSYAGPPFAGHTVETATTTATAGAASHRVHRGIGRGVPSSPRSHIATAAPTRISPARAGVAQ
jgi:hypothetical protein